MKALMDAQLAAQRMLDVIEVGTRDRPRKVRRLLLAIERLAVYRADRVPNLSDDAPNGSTTSMATQAEKDADLHVSRMAYHDAVRLAQLLQDASDIVLRYTVPINTTGMKLNPPPGCVSCGRQQHSADGTQRPGYFAPVATRFSGKRLCIWCGEYHGATGKLPPPRAVEIYHTQSPAAAGRWLARNAPKPKRRARART